MKANQILLGNGETLIDLTEDTVTPSDLKKGVTAHDASGEIIVGTHDDEFNWEPHDGMPDLTSLDLSGMNNCALFTYDASQQNKWIGLNLAGASGTAIAIEVGTIANGEFIVETAITGKKGATVYRIEFPETQYRWPVVRTYCATKSVTAFQLQTSPYIWNTTDRDNALDNAIVDCRIKGASITTIISSSPFTYFMEHVQLEDINNITSMSSCFYNRGRIQQIDFVNCTMSKVTTFYRMFYGCYALRKVTGYENWNTAKVTNMNSAFYQCPSLLKLDLSKWNTAAVTTFDSMFNNCKMLAELNLNNWDTSSATTFYRMFGDCSSLQKMDLRHFNTSNCTNFSYMFNNMVSVKEINVAGWDISKGTEFGVMFNNLYCIGGVDLSTWTMPTLSEAKKMTQFLYQLYSVSEIRIPDGIEYALSLSYMMLSKESVDYIVEHIGTANGTQTLTLGNAKLKMTAEQKTIIANKGWTLA